MRKLSINLLLVLALFLFTNNVYAQSDEAIRANWIFNIAPGVTWENQDTNPKFTIGVFSSQKEYDEIKKLAKTHKINGKPVEVIHYLSYKDVNPHNIIYVTKNENANLVFIYKKLKEKNVLIISDRSKQPQYSVINLNKIGANQPFTINGQLYKEQNLKFSLALLRLGGDRVELKKVQEETNKKLIAEKKELENKRQEIENKDKEIEELKEKLRKCKQKNKTE